MSLARPTTLPVWATVSGSVSVPSAGKQASGWTINEAPAFDYFNWHQNLTYEWIDHLDRRVNTPTQKVIALDFVTGLVDITGLATSMPTNRTYVSIDNTGSNAFQVDLNKLFRSIVGTQNVTITEITIRSRRLSGVVFFGLDRYDHYSVTGNGFGPTVSNLEFGGSSTVSSTFDSATTVMNRPLDLDTFAYRLGVQVDTQVASGDIWLLSAIIKYTETEVQ